MKKSNNEEVNGYIYTKQWFDFASKNPDKIKPAHGILYFAMVELNNKLGWIENFGLPTSCTMNLIGIRNYKTFKKTFDDLVEWGFVRVIEKSHNQYTANIIALVKFTKAKEIVNQMADTKENTKTDDKCSGKIYLRTALSTTLTNAHIIKQEETNKTVQTILGINNNESTEIIKEDLIAPDEKEDLITEEDLIKCRHVMPRSRDVDSPNSYESINAFISEALREARS